jgi:YhgE/Pip-like protein
MRLPALNSGGLELRRFARNRLTRIAVAGLVLLPLLYAGLYLWSFWDPYARLQHVPVALVVDDKPAKAGGRTVHAGADLADELKKRKVFDWKTVDEATARDGVRSGRYYMALTIPADFSSRIASPSGSGSPTPAALRLEMNDANNYVVGTLAQAAFKEVSTAAGSKATNGYFDQIFVSFGKLHGELGKAADGAGKLANGADKAHSAGRQLTTGLGTLHDGTGQLSDGSRRVADGMQRLTTVVDKASDTVVPLLREHAPEIRSAALIVAEGVDKLADAAGELPARSHAAVRQARAAQADLDRYLAAHPEVPPNVRHELHQAAAQVVDVARQVDAFIQAHTADLKKLAADAHKAEGLARKVAADAPRLAGKVEAARRNVDRLNDGARQVASGASRIDAGTGQALAGTTKLTGGLGELADGNGELATGLKKGAKQVPSYGNQERADRADMMSSPVKLASTTDNKAPNYGTGFAPFFVPLALWVGGMVVYMLLRPLNPRALASTAPGWRVALAGWLPAAAIGVAQVGVVLAVLHFGLGLEAARWPGLIAFLSLASAAFLAVIQWVNARFGPVGRIIALALLMLQLTSAAGTYPIETSPGFFQSIQPYLPMPWVVTAVRHLISGGTLTPVWQGCAVLAAFLLGGLALTALAARKNRVWTVKRLHPVLKL